MSLLVSNPVSAALPETAIPTEASFTFTLQPKVGEALTHLCRRLSSELRVHSATPLHLLIFGKVSAYAEATDTLQMILGRAHWPVTWVEGAACDGNPIAGIQVHAFTGEVERIEHNGHIVGSVFTEGGARQCFVGGLMPTDQTLSRADQTRQTLGDLQKILIQAGFELADTVRTWFFLENILSWYDDFNQARTKIYSGIKFRTDSLPASTGVSAKNPAGTALTLAALAFRPLEKNARAEEIASPLQCPAPAYGSSFSRAMELPTNTGRRLHISGTASITPDGKTLWAGDVHKQVGLTMDVVGEILRSRGFTFADLTRATAYFRYPTDASVFAQWLTANQLTQMPVVSAQCDVCRDDLLFELEAEAEKTASNYRDTVAEDY
jgi:enamine deaminase RidA (YjgF/YER057c/UK114 family)